MMTDKEHALAVTQQALDSGQFCPQLQDEVTAFRDKIKATESHAAIARLVSNLTTTLAMHTCNDHN